MNLKIRRYLTAAIITTAVSLFGPAVPATAGEYVFDSGNTTTTGSFTLTITDPSDWAYPGWSSNLGYPMGIGFGFKHGSASWNGTQTLQFHWVPDMDFVTGLPDPDDTPPADGEMWSVTLGGPSSASYYQGQVYNDGSGDLDWNASSEYSYSAYHLEAVGTAEHWSYDPVTYMMTQTGSYSFNSSSTGDSSVELVIKLEGTDPTATVTFNGTAHASGDMQMNTYLLAGAPAKTGEEIGHFYPVKDDGTEATTLPNKQLIAANGGWRGLSGQSYKVEHWFRDPDGHLEDDWFSSAMNGTGGALTWGPSDTCYPTSADDLWRTTAVLWRRNSHGQYIDNRGASSFNFHVQGGA